MSLSAPKLQSFQKAEVIPNKVDKDGHHYLKVLLLSNKKTKNNWIAPYKNIGELPKSVLDSFLNLPHVSKHDHDFFDKLDEDMKKQGLGTDERYQTLLQKCNEIKDGYIDHLFLENPNATALYGQWKVTDPEENKHIEQYGEPSKIFTSPALAGTYDEQEDGTKVYHIDTIRAFHLAGVPIPAFDEDEAIVKGICKNGNSESCRNQLQYAGLDEVQAPITSTTPMENVNNTCSCNSNIDKNMSANDSNKNSPPEVNTTGQQQSGSLLKETYPSGHTIQYTPSTGTGSTSVKIEPSVSDKPDHDSDERTVVDSTKKEILKSEKQIKEDREKEQLEAQVQALLKQNNDQKNFFLDEMLSVHIPRTSFEKEEDYDAEKNVFKTFINKYEVSLEDAKWLITKAVTKPVLQAPIEEEKKKPTGDKRQYAGYIPPGEQFTYPSMFQTEMLTTPNRQQPPTKSGAFLSKKDTKPQSVEEDFEILL